VRGNKRTVLVLVGTAVATFVLVFGYRSLRASYAEPAQPTGPAHDEELAHMKHEIEQMRRASVGMRQLVQQAALSASAENAVEPAQPGLAAAQSAHAPALTREEHLAYIETEFGNEVGNAEWNPTNDLRGKLTPILPEGSSIRSLQCRRTMCRVETSHKDLVSYQAFARAFVLPGDNGQPLWMGASVFNVTTPPGPNDESLVTVAYLAREGLPEPLRD
jgi:hypothetical protein